ncbi:MarR family transcriptional regulator [Natronosporangium hydrolyticum]|uniref:MarR family transcriptional regulator n=1 Tax=Natronosporangium hydrolyticum TaxID=2811111 RepID=A0A895YF59_9ACTN|nr:MarR family transcriptional regulator [Natronosporangium hydrolyticum]QSB14772.1 MarR family transcriptional regulator [Natronosporangium hydrolyticum]
MEAELYDDERITAFGLFAEVYTGLVTRFSAQLAEHGLALIEFEVLVRLARTPAQQLRMTELAGQVALTTSGITRVVDRLEREDLVRRRPCPEDRRGSWTALTATGQSRLSAALPDHLALLDRHFTGHFSAAERTQLVVRLREIRDEVHPAARPASPGPQNRTGRTSGRNRDRPGSPPEFPDKSPSTAR